MAQPARHLQPAPVPPQNLEAEASVLGAMLLAPSAILGCAEILQPADFYRETNGDIFRTIVEMFNAGDEVDAITVADRLAVKGQLADVGDTARVHELAALVPATANAAHYARIVREIAQLRALIGAGDAIARLGWERPGQTDELVERAEQIVFALSDDNTAGELEHVSQSLEQTTRRLQELHDKGISITGLPAGIRELDDLTSGFHAGELIVIAARPSMGKSALVLQIAANVAVRQQQPVALFTLEMRRDEVNQRLLSLESNVNLQSFRKAQLNRDDWAKILDAVNSIHRAPLYIDDTAEMRVMQMRAKARRLKAREPNLALVIVDYLQLLVSDDRGENRVAEISAITRSLKILARELELPVIALSQLNRSVEQRPDKRPLLSDLRESGSIEQDADLVAFIYRDDYYRGEKSDKRGIAELHVAKQRHGPTSTVELAWLRRTAKFSDLARPSDRLS